MVLLINMLQIIMSAAVHNSNKVVLVIEELVFIPLQFFCVITS